MDDLLALVSKAEKELEKGNRALAVELAGEVIDALSTIGERDRQQPTQELAIRANITAANGLLMAGKPQQLLQFAEEAIRLREAHITDENKIQYGIALNLKAVALSQLARFPEAISAYTSAYQIHSEAGFTAGMARNLSNRAIMYNYISDFAKALECLQSALKLYEELGDRNGIATAYVAMADVWSDLGKDEVSLKCYRQALEMFDEVGNKHAEASVYVNLGIQYRKLDDFDNALQTFVKALELNKALGIDLGVANVLGNIGNLYSDKKMPDEALNYHQQSLEMHRSINNKIGMATRQGCIGLIYGDYKSSYYNFDKAEKYLLEALALFKEIGRKMETYQAHENLANLYKAAEQWQKCVQQLEAYYALKEEVQGEETKRHAEVVLMQHEQAERDKEQAIERAAFAAKHDATQSLLHKVLPDVIAARILGGEKEIADYFASVSILFVDMEGFTPMSANMPAHIVVRLLNFVFGEFDRILKKYGCEKIKTIGDGYMAIAGAPVPCADHAERMARAALELQSAIILPEEIQKFIPQGSKYGVRIGIHTGPVVAGLVGEERFVYDVYSDAVNTASRMESHGQGGRIHISEDFVKALNGKFSCEERGEINIKGKGKMKTYFLLKEKP